jgi:hypothetical protein
MPVQVGKQVNLQKLMLLSHDFPINNTVVSHLALSEFQKMVSYIGKSKEFYHTLIEDNRNEYVNLLTAYQFGDLC